MARLVAAVSAAGFAGAVSSVCEVRALQAADHLHRCAYRLGFLPSEGSWQSGNTLESLARLMLNTNSTRWASLLEESFTLTPPVFDTCYDDHQWWLLAWIRGYEATGQVKYLQRAAEIFDDTAKKAWTDVCGGGVMWCPVAGSQKQYKNAITNELFLTSAMRLHPHAQVLGKDTNYYLNWAQKEWAWFSGSGMINSQGLVNDGLTDDCRNNGQTTWTYNQGVMLDGLALLTAATGNHSHVQVAERVARAATTLLSPGGILVEPNADGSGDQQLFKGIFARHLGDLALRPEVDQSFKAEAAAYLAANAESIVAKDRCTSPPSGVHPLGYAWLYGMDWRGACGTGAQTRTTATTSAALDALTSAAALGACSGAAGSGWTLLGLGNCQDGAGQPMANCYKENVDEVECEAAAAADAGAVGYDVETTCSGGTFCRVRTLSGAHSCGAGWQFSEGSATTIVGGNGASLAICFGKAAPSEALLV